MLQVLVDGYRRDEIGRVIGLWCQGHATQVEFNLAVTEHWPMLPGPQAEGLSYEYWSTEDGHYVRSPSSDLSAFPVTVFRLETTDETG